ncbi:hypothetical protein O5O45_08885 [Hahella aquimaris]|uniref:hypothetical protein n=1 Tax=Hahella sp. HNIBRBA332 TaxID=3015983 RepID=UPI00273AC3C3|nr:hypothetical protein [Hahella sp. HNIBRBA332]WLQ16027.1 hypothetical protein O5O45_08885 [Hahella sp. HNIBRBA332]
MKLKSKLLLVMCSLLIGCSSKQFSEPTHVVITYGNILMSAPIDENNTFASTIETDTKYMQLSGKIQKQNADYIVDVDFISNAKEPEASHAFNSQVLVKLEEPQVIGHADESDFIINLKR